MTAQTIREVPDALFLVFLRNFTLIVLVAGIAGVGRVAVGMAGRAGAASITMVHREAVETVVGRRPPGARRVAQSAIEPE
jgi:hypothetical protein